MEETGACYEYLADAFGTTHDAAAGLPLVYRRAHAGDLSRALARVERIEELLGSTWLTLDTTEHRDWELRRLTQVSLKAAHHLDKGLNRALTRTISRGPSAVADLDKQCLSIQAYAWRAKERAHDLAIGQVSIGATNAESQSGISYALVSVTVRFLPTLHQGRYLEEFKGEFSEQRTVYEKLAYGFRILRQAGALRRSLTDEESYLAATASGEGFTDWPTGLSSQ